MNTLFSMIDAYLAFVVVPIMVAFVLIFGWESVAEAVRKHRRKAARPNLVEEETRG